MTYPHRKASLKVERKMDNSKPVFPCVVLTPDNRIAVYFAEQVAFIEPEEGQQIDGIHSGLFTENVTQISNCRPVAHGTRVIFEA